MGAIMEDFTWTVLGATLAAICYLSVLIRSVFDTVSLLIGLLFSPNILRRQLMYMRVGLPDIACVLAVFLLSLFWPMNHWLSLPLLYALVFYTAMALILKRHQAKALKST